ncbi:MAG: hypothetical protein QOK10_2552 [Pseudonocardiales bacterium]|nr:hypothetical protein [Pseudonocardiales bacterium]
MAQASKQANKESDEQSSEDQSSQEQSGGSQGFLSSLRHSPATEKLTQEVRSLFQAQSGKLVGKVGDRLEGSTKLLQNVGKDGQLPPMAEGAKKLVAGEGPLKAGLSAAKEGVVQKVKGLFGKSGKGGGKTKSLNIEESIDVGVPVSVAYDQWTQFQDFSRYMKGVESVEQTSEVESNWRAKVFKSRRSWKATIQEQVPDRRIVWTSEGAKGSTKGVVTFHPLADDLTRVLVALEYFPSGLMEKTGNLWRAAGRRARLDLKLYRRFIMMEDEPTGSWRGEIRDGQVVKQPDEGEDQGRQSDQSDTSQGESGQQQGGDEQNANGRSRQGDSSSQPSAEDSQQEESDEADQDQNDEQDNEQSDERDDEGDDEQQDQQEGQQQEDERVGAR